MSGKILINKTLIKKCSDFKGIWENIRKFIRKFKKICAFIGFSKNM